MIHSCHDVYQFIINQMPAWLSAAGLPIFMEDNPLNLHWAIYSHVPGHSWEQFSFVSPTSCMFHSNLILVGGFNHIEKYESQLGWLSSIYGKMKNVPNHQSEYNFDTDGKNSSTEYETRSIVEANLAASCSQILRPMFFQNGWDVWGILSYRKAGSYPSKQWNSWMTGWWFQPLWKIWVRQLGLWHSQYMESHKILVPNHQPIADLYFLSIHFIQV